MKLANVSNPAAFGVEWQSGGSRYQLCNPRGTTCLMWGAETGSGKPWMTSTVVRPERFGMTDAPRNGAAFRKIAEAFTADSED